MSIEEEDRNRFFGAVITGAALVATGGTAAFTGVAGGLSTFSAAGALAVAQVSAISLAAGYAYSALAGNTSLPDFRNQVRSYDINQLGSALPTAQVYGETKIGGAIFYQETTIENDYLHRMIAFADHEIESFEEVYLDEYKLTLADDGRVSGATDIAGNEIDIFTSDEYAVAYIAQIQEKLGTADQSYSPIDGSEVWDASHTASGVAYLHCTFLYSADAYPSGAPTITAVVKGKKLYDPRTQTTAYSNNSALVLRDYLISSGIADASEINETLFSAAANICDEDETLTDGTTEKKYTCNGSFTTDVDPAKIIGTIVDTMGGMVWYSQGKWGCKAAKYTAPVLALNEDDFRSGLSISTRNSRKDGFNKVIGLFRSPETNWQQTNFPSITSPTFLNVDGGQENTLEMDLPFVTSSATAQRIAKIALYRNREQLKISGSFGMRALNLTVGDLVTITYDRLGFDAKVFEVTEWTFGLASDMTLQVSMSLQEISSGIFNWDADETAFESNNTTLTPAFSVPAVGLSHTVSEVVYNEKITSTLFVTVSSTHPEQIDSVEVELIRTTKGDADVNFMGIVISFLRIIVGTATTSELFLFQTDPSNQYFGNISDLGTQNISIDDVICLLRRQVGLENTTAQDNYIDNTFVPTMVNDPVKYGSYVTVQPYQEEFVVVNKGDLGLFEFKDIEEGDYTVRARGINAHGTKGPWVER